MADPMRKLLLCLCAICFMLAGGLQAAPRFTHFTKQSSGLCYDGVKIILEDSRSNIWIGTYKGLSCYDGKGFRNYDRNDFGVDSDHVSSLAEDAKGNIWIGTDYGIVIYERAVLVKAGSYVGSITSGSVDEARAEAILNYFEAA